MADVLQCQTGAGVKIEVHVPRSRHTLGGTMRTHPIPASGLDNVDYLRFLQNTYEEVKNVFGDVVQNSGGVKWYLSLNVTMSRRID